MTAAGYRTERFGPFILLKSLGSGGMGTAHLAAHPGTKGLLVVKRMHPGMVREPTLFKRFVHEAEVASHVHHPNVATLVAMGTVDGEPFLATEFVFGIQVSQIVHRVHDGAIDPLPIGVALQMAADLAHGLRAIHQARHRETAEPLGLVHRDVGARNVLVGFDGRARLIDLGLGKSVLADWQTATEVLAGSPDYMPPEQAMGSAVDARADVYAAAVTIWELVTGQKRIREDTVAARVREAIAARPETLLDRRPDAPESLEHLLQRAMDPDPDRRLPSAAVLASGFESELRKLWGASSGRSSGRSAVREWLDAACATIIARERREIQQLRATVPELDQADSQVEVIVGAIHGWVPFEEPPETRAPWRAAAERGLRVLEDPARWLRVSPAQLLVALGTFTVVLCATAALTVWWLLPDRAATGVSEARTPAVDRPAEPPAPAVSAAPAPNTPSASPPERVPVRRPDPAKPPPATPVLRARRSALLMRIKRLRRLKYEVEWQRRLTGLSAQLSRAHTLRALDQVESALSRMEKSQ